MTDRPPAPRYLADGLYARHDGKDIIVDSCDGIRILNALTVSAETEQAIADYHAYAHQHYRTRNPDDPVAPETRQLAADIHAHHDGYQTIVVSKPAAAPTQTIALNAEVLEALGSYRAYVQEYYRHGQHLAPSGCEDCGTDITYHRNPIQTAVRGEIYRIDDDGQYREIRLCRQCASFVDQEFLQEILDRRATNQ